MTNKDIWTVQLDWLNIINLLSKEDMGNHGLPLRPANGSNDAGNDIKTSSVQRTCYPRNNPG